jgi:hypothetical protein
VSRWCGLIEDYAFLSDLKIAALVHRRGSIDWFCFPRFDSDACLAADRTVSPPCRGKRSSLAAATAEAIRWGWASAPLRLTELAETWLDDSYVLVHSRWAADLPNASRAPLAPSSSFILRREGESFGRRLLFEPSGHPVARPFPRDGLADVARRHASAHNLGGPRSSSPTATGTLDAQPSPGRAIQPDLVVLHLLDLAEERLYGREELAKARARPKALLMTLN